MKPLARIALLAALLAGSTVGSSLAADEVVVLTAGGAHRTVVLVIEGPKGPEIALEDAAKGLDISFSRQGRDAKVTLRSGGREVTLENGKSLFSVGPSLKAMAAPVRVVGERTYVSPPSAATVLGAALGQPAAYRAAYRALVIGVYDAPQLRLANVVAASSIQSTIELSKAVPYEVRKEPNRVVVTFQADLMETDFVAEALPGRIVGTVRFERSTPPRVVFDLGERFASVKTAEKDAQHLSLVFDTIPTASGIPVPGTPPPGATPLPRPVVTPATGFKRPIVLVIDPGHGGEDGGAQGPGGRFEKDLTLALARRLRAAAVDSLSIQAFLTRDDDKEVPLDERAAIANNFNANIFISLHANGSRFASASGPEVFFLSYTAAVGSSRVDLQACKLEYSIVSPK